MMRPDAKVEKVYLYPKPVDFRKSIDGLAALVSRVKWLGRTIEASLSKVSVQLSIGIRARCVEVFGDFSPRQDMLAANHRQACLRLPFEKNTAPYRQCLN
jgi:hypothetical protein